MLLIKIFFHFADVVGWRLSADGTEEFLALDCSALKVVDVQWDKCSTKITNASPSRCANALTKAWSSSPATRKFDQVANIKNCAHVTEENGAASRRAEPTPSTSQLRATCQRNARQFATKSSQLVNPRSLWHARICIRMCRQRRQFVDPAASAKTATCSTRSSSCVCCPRNARVITAEKATRRTRRSWRTATHGKWIEFNYTFWESSESLYDETSIFDCCLVLHSKKTVNALALAIVWLK